MDAVSLLVVLVGGDQAVWQPFFKKVSILVKGPVDLVSEAVLFQNPVFPDVIGRLLGGAVRIFRADRVPILVVNVTDRFLVGERDVGIHPILVRIQKRILLAVGKPLTGDSVFKVILVMHVGDPVGVGNVRYSSNGIISILFHAPVDHLHFG